MSLKFDTYYIDSLALNNATQFKLELSNTPQLMEKLLHGTTRGAFTAGLVEGPPLHWAAYYNRIEICKHLVELGAEVGITGKHGWAGKDAIQVAQEWGYYDIEDFLKAEKLKADEIGRKIEEAKAASQDEIIYVQQLGQTYQSQDFQLQQYQTQFCQEIQQQQYQPQEFQAQQQQLYSVQPIPFQVISPQFYTPQYTNQGPPPPYTHNAVSYQQQSAHVSTYINTIPATAPSLTNPGAAVPTPDISTTTPTSTPPLSNPLLGDIVNSTVSTSSPTTTNPSAINSTYGTITTLQNFDTIPPHFRQIIEAKNPIGDNWTPEHTYYFVMSLPRFKQYATIFLNEDISGIALMELNENDFATHFNMKLGERKELMKILSQMKQS